jgi:mono/diheme cytochrome c family protein
MRYIFLAFGLLAVTVMLVAGKRGDISRRPPIELFPDMDRQPKLRPQTVNAFFGDGLSSQLPVPGTIARGFAFEDTPVNTGKIAGTTNWVANIPVPLTATLMARGRERYTINCSPCHGAQGDGNGITKKLGMLVVANLHEPRLVAMSDGEIFNTITYGKNLMGAYGGNVTTEDRWAIIAYLRALQRSRLGSLGDLPADLGIELKKRMPPATAPAN